VTQDSGTVDGAAIQTWMRRFAEAVDEHRAELVALDTAIGDGDHGTNMDRGMRKAITQMDALADGGIAATLKAVGMALISSVGGAAGPLYGTVFLQMANSAGDAGELDTAGWADAVAAALSGVQARGKAEPGDKTMVDALAPAAEALRAAQAEGLGIVEATQRAADAAQAGMEATIPMEARRGRASYLGPRSVGHQDPGATSTHLLLRSAAEAFAGS